MIVVEMIGEVVDKVSSRLTPQFKQLDKHIEGVQYLHGHPKEIIETLMQRDKSESYRFRKYPLICLFQDFPERDLGVFLEASLNVIICKGTVATYKADERYEHNFKPFLYPIYKTFLQELVSHKDFELYYPKDLTKIDRLFWGKIGVGGNERNIFNDKLDAIELLFKIKVKKERC